MTDGSSTETPLRRFRLSMVLNYEKWHDGIGYDLEALEAASESERKTIEDVLINHTPRDWRDVEALSKLDTKNARETMKKAMKDPDHLVRLAVLRYAPHIITEEERARSLIQVLESIKIFEGVSHAMNEVALFHPPEVVNALIRGVLNREGEIAVHYVAILFYIYGRSRDVFDMDQRDFFLRFNTKNRHERLKAFQTLCDMLKINCVKYIKNEN